MKKKMISLLLVLALVVGICPAAFAVEKSIPEGKVLSSVYDEETGVLTLETDNETITVTLEDTDEGTVLTQYNDGVLFDRVLCTLPDEPMGNEAQLDIDPQQIIDQLSTYASHRYFMGTVYYTGGLNPTYTMNVKVYDTYEDPIRTEYTPPNGTLTAAQIVANAATVLGVPASVVSGPVGTVISIIGLVSSGIVWWMEGKQPKLTCDKYKHTFSMYHYGTSPVYYPGEVVTRTGTHYHVKETTYEEQTKKDYYEGFFIHGPTREDALTIYYAMYGYTDWEFIRWDSAV